MSIEISPLLDIAWDILQFVIAWGWILFALIFLMVMGSTVVAATKKLSEKARPGIQALLARGRKR